MTSVWDGLTYFDDILTADIVRNTRNVLDIVNSRDYKLKSKGKLVYEGDSVQVISYQATHPSISTTGDPAVQTYSGEIYVNLKDLAVLKNVVNLTSRDFNGLGRNLVTINEKPKSDVKMTITTTYKKLKSVYFLSGVQVEYSYKEEGKEVKVPSSIWTCLGTTFPTSRAGDVWLAKPMASTVSRQPSSLIRRERWWQQDCAVRNLIKRFLNCSNKI